MCSIPYFVRNAQSRQLCCVKQHRADCVASLCSALLRWQPTTLVTGLGVAWSASSTCLLDPELVSADLLSTPRMDGARVRVRIPAFDTCVPFPSDGLPSDATCPRR